MSRRTRTISGILATTLVALAATTALASTITGGDNYVVAAGETITGNLYAFGQTIRIEGTVTGDLVSAGSQVEIAPGGVVQGDLTAAGQSVIVKGEVKGDVRAGGFQILIDKGAKVGGELMAGGFSVGIAESASVGDDFTAGASQGFIDGSVEGDARFGGQGLDIQGSVGGDVDAEVGAPSDTAQDMTWMKFMPGMQEMPAITRTVPPGLTIGPDAQIGGTLTYTSPEPSSVSQDAAAGGVAYTQQAVATDDAEAAAAPETSTDKALGWIATFLKWYISLALFGLILAWVAPRFFGRTGQVLDQQLAPSAGVGCGTILLALAGLVTLAIATIFGLIFVSAIQLGPLVKPLLSASFLTFAVLTAGTLLLAWVGRIAVAYWIGRLILARLAPARAENRYVCLLVGLLIWVPLISLPWIGGLIDFVGVVLGLGALMIQLWAALRPWFTGAPAEAPPLEGPPLATV